MTLYQLNASSNRLPQAINHVLHTWQDEDSLLLLGLAGVLAEKITQEFPQFTDKILTLENTNFVGNNITKISFADWLNLTQQNSVITLDFS